MNDSYPHHVGHVVEDMAAALEVYRRLGFTMPAPAYPAIAPREGAEPEPVGAANTHAELDRGFVELVTCVRPGSALPAGATVVPLAAPPAALPVLRERIEATSRSVAGYLDRFQGLHILMLAAPDIDATADRLTAAGVEHGGVNTVTRPSPTGGPPEVIRFLELSGDVPEGRVGAAVPPADPPRPAHPNGAVALTGAVLCVPDADLAATTARYRTYLGATGGAVVDVVARSALPEVLPGAAALPLPAFVAYRVAVRDLATTERLLRGNGFHPARTAAGELVVPPAEVLGAAVVFHRA